jgi:hypothetical protein
MNNSAQKRLLQKNVDSDQSAEPHSELHLNDVLSSHFENAQQSKRLRVLGDQQLAAQPKGPAVSSTASKHPRHYAGLQC